MMIAQIIKKSIKQSIILKTSYNQWINKFIKIINQWEKKIDQENRSDNLIDY